MIFEESFASRIDPRVKLSALIFFFLICLLPSKLYSSFSLFILSLLLSLSLGVMKNVYKARLLLTTVFLFTVLLWLISRGLKFLATSISIAFKLDSMIVGGIIFISITRQEELLFALRKFFVPFRPAFAISLSMRFVPVILNLIEIVVQAQKVRGYRIGGNPLKRVKKTIPLIGPVLLYVLRWTDKLSIALEARGFSSPWRIDYYEWKMSLRDFLILLLFLFLFSSLLFLRIEKLI